MFALTSRRSVARLAAVAGIASLALTAAPSVQASPLGKPSAPPAQTGAASTQLGVEMLQAQAALGQTQALKRQVASLTQQVGRATGGTYVDSRGRLVATVTTAKAAGIARLQGIKAVRVDDTQAELAGVMRRLNRQAEQQGVGSVQGWRVDVEKNAVLVTLTRGAADAKAAAFARFARKLGDVRFERSSAAAAPATTEAIYGGLEYRTGSATRYGLCSVGFNAVDASNRHVFLTAGHCLTSRPQVHRNGYMLGNTRSFNFPVDDFGVVNNHYPNYWTPRPWVSQYNGRAMYVRGSWLNPPVGATVCKSGRTTGWTCGVIRSFNQTVNYGAHGIVYGLVRHTACVEQGDSGGSNISAGGYALGLTSGASMTSTGKCRQKVGLENISYYQPIGEALTRNGLRLLVQP